MTFDQSMSGADCITLAIQFYREPSRFPDLVHGRNRLPTGITSLLQIAAGNRIKEELRAVRGISADELQQAALFFIEQVFLAHHANHYRTLGLEPGADISEIKEHHRLLMRLFHPDRQTTPDERIDAIATRINQAYNVLRSPHTRTTYDLTLTEKHAARPLVPSYHKQQQLVVEPDDSPPRIPHFVLRHLPQFALGSVALVAALSVMLVYVNRTPTGAIGATSNHLAHSTENHSPPTTPPERLPERLPELPPATSPALAEPSPIKSPPPSPPPLAEINPEPPSTPIAEPEPNRETKPVIITAAMQIAGPRPVARPAATPHQAPATQERLPPPATAITVAAPVAPVAITPAVAVNVPIVPEIKPEPLRTDQLNSLVSSLTDRYQRGDLENLLELFDPTARTEKGDKRQIRSEYGELFRNSESRVLHIWDIAWSRDGKLTRGVGSFQARVVRKGESSPRIHGGSVTIEVIQHNDRPIIVGLYHKAESN